jgi:catechol 2,3-dioxygenase-like lactoylglutathione lyase family enzyme
MLATKDATATVAVKDLDNARKFYGGTLGLPPIEVPEEEEVAAYQAGGTRLLVYRSQFAGTNRATSVTWNVGGEVDTIVKDLRGKGVRFERYEFPEVVHEGDVHVMGGMRAAWFKDPEGNIHALVSH